MSSDQLTCVFLLDSYSGVGLLDRRVGICSASVELPGSLVTCLYHFVLPLVVHEHSASSPTRKVLGLILANLLEIKWKPVV